MNLHHLLAARTAAGRPVRAALIGAGKFGSMFLSQVPTTPGLDIAGIVDLSPDRAREACRSVGWDEARLSGTKFTNDAAEPINSDDVEVIIEATVHPASCIRHARFAIKAGNHSVTVNVEADALVGP